MVVAAPLVLPAAGAVLKAIAFVGSAIAAGLGIGALADAIDDEFPDKAPSSVQECDRAVPTPPVPPECGDIVRRMQERTQELRQRFEEMLEDRHGLYAIRPAAKPPFGSWPGHLQQYVGKQANLIKLMTQAAAMGCPVPPDAEEWATRPPPLRPST